MYVYFYGFLVAETEYDHQKSFKLLIFPLAPP